MRREIISAGLLIMLLCFQNCGQMTSSGTNSGGDNDAKVNRQIPNSKPEVIEFSLNPFASQSFDLSLNADGSVRDAADQVLVAYANLSEDIKQLFADASICEITLPPGASVCLAYTFPIAAAKTVGGDVFMLVHNPLCAQERFDLCGNVGARLASIITQIRQP